MKNLVILLGQLLRPFGYSLYWQRAYVETALPDGWIKAEPVGRARVALMRHVKAV